MATTKPAESASRNHLGRTPEAKATNQTVASVQMTLAG